MNYRCETLTRDDMLPCPKCGERPFAACYKMVMCRICVICTCSNGPVFNELLGVKDAVAAWNAYAGRGGMKRVQMQGDLWHGVVPEGAIYVGRAAPGLKASPYRNPFTVNSHGENALRLFVAHLDENPELVTAAVRDLSGHDLACWCKPGAPCHADELIRRILAAEERK